MFSASLVALRGVHEFVRQLYARQEAEGLRGKAHSAKHQYSVALNAAMRAEQLARAHGFSEDEARHVTNLAWIMGITHDLIRNPAEKAKGAGADIRKTDGYATALELWHNRRGTSHPLREALGHLHARDVLDMAIAIKENERDNVAVSKTIANKLRMGRVRQAILLDALTFGDKAAEGTGPTVVKRRAEFVAGERHNNPEDLGDYAHAVRMSEAGRSAGITTVHRSRLLVYALESLLRIHGLKPVSAFPEGMREEITRRRGMELEVYHGVMKYLRFHSERSLLDFGLKTGYPNLEENLPAIERELSCSSVPDIAGIPATKAVDAALLVGKFAGTTAAEMGIRGRAPTMDSVIRSRAKANYSRWMRQIDLDSKTNPVSELERRLGLG